jgi:hypothetical protein
MMWIAEPKTLGHNEPVSHRATSEQLALLTGLQSL